MEFENENLPNPVISDDQFPEQEMKEESVSARPSLETSIKKREAEESPSETKLNEDKVPQEIQRILNVSVVNPVQKPCQAFAGIDLEDPADISEDEEEYMPSRSLKRWLKCRKRLLWRMSIEKIVLICVWTCL